jgi:AcrR family transcriptional regulator
VTRSDRRPRLRLDPAQRRAAILDAARDAFARAPYGQVSLASVATEAGASEALVHKYFATKGALYAEVVADAIESLLQRQFEADAALGPRATARQRLTASVDAYLEFVSTAPEGWAAPLRDPSDDAAEAASLRAAAQERYVTLLRAVLGLPRGQPRDHALRGYLGFLDAACLSWVNAGCPRDQRPAITAAALGALDGALAALPPASPGTSPHVTGQP